MWGVHQMLGGVWEWTASDFAAYPGFRSFPYREYSEVFFGPDYKVLRGGSWATHPSAVRTTFRNWDYPIRRQIFAGFRCARRASHLMCRHLGYLGAPVVLHDLLFGAPHSLCAQARDPRYQISGQTNPDGWGVAWYPEPDAPGSQPAPPAPSGTAPSPRSGTTPPSRPRRSASRVVW